MPPIVGTTGTAEPLMVIKYYMKKIYFKLSRSTNYLKNE